MITKRLLVGNVDDAKNPPPEASAVLMVAEEQNVTVPPRVVYAKIPLKEFGEPTVCRWARLCNGLRRMLWITASWCVAGLAWDVRSRW